MNLYQFIGSSDRAEAKIVLEAVRAIKHEGLCPSAIRGGGASCPKRYCSNDYIREENIHFIRNKNEYISLTEGTSLLRFQRQSEVMMPQ